MIEWLFGLFIGLLLWHNEIKNHNLTKKRLKSIDSLKDKYYRNMKLWEKAYHKKN